MQQGGDRGKGPNKTGTTPKRKSQDYGGEEGKGTRGRAGQGSSKSRKSSPKKTSPRTTSKSRNK